MSHEDLTSFFYMREAYNSAIKNSTDPRTQNGAVLIDKDGDIVVRSANHFAKGVENKLERWVSPDPKYKFVEHAERNLIYEAARRGISTQGLTVFCPYFACADCARALIQSGVRKVIGHDAPFHKAHPGWEKSIEIGDIMFREAGLLYERLRFPRFIGLSIIFNGELVNL